jgi:acetyl esterase/lipase
MAIRKLSLLFALLTFFISTEASAQEVARAPLPPGVRALLDVPYVTNGHERQKLDLYLPEKSDNSRRPVVVRIHGGAWRHGDKSGQQSAANYVKQGYIGVAINYRFSQHAPFPAQIEDCKAAIRWLKAHSDEYGIDPERIAVMGGSAGGHLAALLGTSGDTKMFDVGEHLDQSSSVCAVVNQYGPTDLLLAAKTPGYERGASAVTQFLGGPISTKRELAIKANPITYVTTQDPPFLILHGDADPIVPVNQSDELHKALRETGVSSNYNVVKGGAHGGDAFKGQKYKQLVKIFLQEHLVKSAE